MDAPTDVTQRALRPTRLVATIRRVAGPVWQRGGRAAVLEVAGRTTGRTLRLPLIPVEIDGRTYLLAFGGVTEWSRNLRASGRGELVRKGRLVAFKAVEVEGDERLLVIAKYLAGTGPLKNDFYRRPAPDDHPTFRLEPLT